MERDARRSSARPAGRRIAEKLAHFLGPWSALVHDRLVVRGTEPFASILFFGWETLAYMLFGMAALKSGFFRGEWPAARYLRVAAIGLAIAIPAYALLAWLLLRDGFRGRDRDRSPSAPRRRSGRSWSSPMPR